ncbi:MAG TPA: NAD(P)-binding protein, partial [Alphaproteobacteria bacterium]|nr:NAD(P)-binding protein [Alphaproteobacteria bacterium]
MPLQIAIVGSGPAGCYAAEKLVRDAPGARVDIVDRLPIPYGLVRAGVAPDHQGTKAITRVFQRVLDRDTVRF